MDKQDHLRFIHDLYEFNDVNNIYNTRHHIHQLNNPNAKKQLKPRQKIVDILAFCLMPNHYHLLLSPRIEKAVTLFMKKIGTGYANYFNQKYKRSGTLFEGRYKSILITDEKHFIHLPYYIHLNPLDLCSPEWRERIIPEPEKSIEFLENYRWSSHLDYIGKKNFPSVTNRNLLIEYFNGSERYKKSIHEWIINMKNNFNLIKQVTLE